MVIGDWLKNVTYPFAAQLTPENAYTGAMIGLMESIHSSITTTLDYMFAHPVEGLSDAVIKAMSDLKIRGVYARGFVSEGEKYGTQKVLIKTPEKVIEDFKRLIETYEKKSNGMIKYGWRLPLLGLILKKCFQKPGQYAKNITPVIQSIFQKQQLQETKPRKYMAL